MKNKRIFALLMACVLCLGLLAGCGNSSSDNKTPGTDANNTAAPGADNSNTDTPAEKVHPTLNLRITTDVTSLDPQVTSANEEYNIFSQIFDSLYRFNGSDSEPVPALATDYTLSEDGTVYTFTLREGVKWHDGSDFTADDVVFTVNRFLTMPATKNKAAFVTGAEKIDDHTVSISLQYAYPNFVMQLCSYPWCIVSKNAVEKYGDDNENMLIGTGPYKFVSNTTGVGVTLEVNENYWGDEPYFETVNYKVIPDNNTALTALLNGEIDLDSVSSTLDVNYVKDTKGYTVHEFQRCGAYFVAFNMGEAPFNNEYFRKAIAYAINKDEYVQLVWNGQAIACPKATMISSYEEGYSDKIPSYDYDVEKAKEMLALSGLSQEEMTFSLTVSTTGYGPAFGAAFQESMKAIGVTVNLNSVEAGAQRTQLFAGEYEASAYNLASVPYNAPLFYRAYLKPTGYICRNSTLNIDSMIDAANAELDDAKRIATYEEINQIVGEACAYVPIAYQKMNYACSENMKGMNWQPSLLTDYICNWYWEA